MIRLLVIALYLALAFAAGLFVARVSADNNSCHSVWSGQCHTNYHWEQGHNHANGLPTTWSPSGAPAQASSQPAGDCFNGLDSTPYRKIGSNVLDAKLHEALCYLAQVPALYNFVDVWTNTLEVQNGECAVYPTGEIAGLTQYGRCSSAAAWHGKLTIFAAARTQTKSKEDVAATLIHEACHHWQDERSWTWAWKLDDDPLWKEKECVRMEMHLSHKYGLALRTQRFYGYYWQAWGLAEWSQKYFKDHGI